ncbi:MAG TPA: glycerol-3-phosphate dehydrogenase/oxidase [Bdellovibrionota bacterium]|nr:glycerol-3-phosphate dehydrogenase/oxidase [Bdellovibrionota bacterium]
MARGDSGGKALAERPRSAEFSSRTRADSIRRFGAEEFDLLVVGGGITGAGTARDAASRGLKVALVERSDFASGTSSRSSKLIHGGLRYLQNFEFDLIFEALAERAHLLRTVPHLVHPLPFLLPSYKGDPHGLTAMSVALWMYDILALFRTPGMHTRLSKSGMLKRVPFLKPEGLKGGFQYYDASMWDDVLTVETLRSASGMGAAIANYVEAVEPLRKGEAICGFKVRDVSQGKEMAPIELRAKRVVVCAGPWTDQVGLTLSPRWRPWLSPSKGVHLIFDLKRLPVTGAMVMAHPEDGRIAFVIPRPDMGNGVTIVGTTDGPAPANPADVTIEPFDVDYLMGLLQKYFPSLNLTTADIISGYAGVRPLMGTPAGTAGSEGQPHQAVTAESLQKISREHYIGPGPGGTILVAGGKYTTYRRMAKEIVDVALEHWQKEFAAEKCPFAPPRNVKASQTLWPLNPIAVEGLEAARGEFPPALTLRYGAEAREVVAMQRPKGVAGAVSSKGGLTVVGPADPEGFPLLEAQLRFAVRYGMVVRLEDFYLRRTALYSSRPDHGLPWAPALAAAWAEERGLDGAAAKAEVQALEATIERVTAWRKRLPRSR